MQRSGTSTALVLALPLLLQAPAKAPSKPSPLDRVIVAGASLSAGFGNLLPFHKVFRKALGEKNMKSTVKETATSLFFMQPLAMGKFQVDKALDFKPTLVVGLDFLFWYLYGELPENKRLERLELGFKQLERFGKIPILLGDIPDMHGASPEMLPPTSIPRTETIGKANEKIHEWVKKHPNVILFPLASFTEKAKKKGWTLEPRPWEKPPFKPVCLKPSQLLQGDKLHPTRAGAWLLGRLVCRTLREKIPALAKTPFRIPASIILEELPAEKAGKKK